MRYYSLGGQSPLVDFKQAVYQGQAPDGSLYFPARIPILDQDWLSTYRKKDKSQIALEVMRPYVENEIPETVFQRICEETCSFDFPLVRVQEGISALELFHGPTMAFKDVGARFMSRCLSYFVQEENKEVTVLVATSGDTGAAVANGFSGAEGVQVIVLYPSGKVSEFQELQMACGLPNVTALEVNGNFDDCQNLVKQAFADPGLRKQKFITSANSINVARWLPQQIYYFLALQHRMLDEAPVISVPSGNFGNLCAGLLARASGLPVSHFIAACNSNQVFTRYLENGKYVPTSSIPTISSAMDVGNPSNFTRIVELFQHSFPRIQHAISSCSVNDNRTADIIRDVYRSTGYLMDPHGAVAFYALQQYQILHPEEQGIFLETAHPAKFGKTMEQITGKPVMLTDSMKEVMKRKKKSIKLEADYKALKAFLCS